jgi:hypothetical protein
VKDGAAARLYNLVADPKEQTNCLQANLSETDLLKVTNVAEDMCKRAAYWYEFTKPLARRCVETVSKNTIDTWWDDRGSCL